MCFFTTKWSNMMQLNTVLLPHTSSNFLTVGLQHSLIYHGRDQAVVMFLPSLCRNHYMHAFNLSKMLHHLGQSHMYCKLYQISVLAAINLKKIYSWTPQRKSGWMWMGYDDFLKIQNISLSAWFLPIRSLIRKWAYDKPVDYQKLSLV